MTNHARFTINADPSANLGYAAANSDPITLQLEASPGVLAQRVVYSVYSASDVNAPLASKSAPLLVLDNGAGSTGQSVQASTPASAVTTTAPAAGVHSYIVRCQINGGVGPTGAAEPDYVFERLLYVPTASGIRKEVYAEGTQCSSRGAADAQNDLVDALVSFAVAAGSAWGDTVYVDAANGNDGSGARGAFFAPYQTITAALAVAQDGDTVLVGPGTYTEDVVVPELPGLTIRSVGGSARTFLVNVAGPCITVLADASNTRQSLVIEGFTCTATGFYALSVDGKADNDLFKDGPLKLEDCRFLRAGATASVYLCCVGQVELHVCYFMDLESSEVSRIRGYGCDNGGNTLYTSWDNTAAKPSTGNLEHEWWDSKIGTCTVSDQAHVRLHAGCTVTTINGVLTDSGAEYGFAACHGRLGTLDSDFVFTVGPHDCVDVSGAQVATEFKLEATGGTQVGRAYARNTDFHFSTANKITSGEKCELSMEGANYAQQSLQSTGGGTAGKIDRDCHQATVNLSGILQAVAIAPPYINATYQVAWHLSAAAAQPAMGALTASGFDVTAAAADATALYTLTFRR